MVNQLCDGRVCLDRRALDSDIGDAFVLRPEASQGAGASEGTPEAVLKLRVPSEKLVSL